MDVRIKYKGLTTYAGASHWQFLAWKAVLQEFLPLNLSRPLGQVLKLDELINARGYLRLMTAEPYTMNLSNTVELPESNRSYETKKKRRLVDLPIINPILMRIYNTLFRYLYRD